MIAAVMPIKGLRLAKSRLASHLSPREREALVLRLADRGLAAIRKTGLAGSIAIVTPDRGTAAALHSEHLPDAGDLNSSLRSAPIWAQRREAEGVLILPGDLPMVTPDDVATVLTQGCGVTIASTHDGGTGALYLAPPQAIAPEFGEGSYARHVLSARERGVPVHEVERPGLHYDLDTVEDLRRFDDLLRAG
jgi:2-phospho-L-lactate/phosphoenolpyruvate guanylyltransferase